jgi:proton glutamate symport protein
MGVSPAISGFVTPLSLSFNLEGSTIHLMMAAVFAAQAAGITLGWERLLLMMVTLKLTSKGVAGIPRANFVILTALFAGFGLPLEALTLLLGIDALIDPVRTALNILGHCVAPIVVARWGPASAASPPAAS